ncbi:MAG TPA: DUF2269 family protein [Acidimicrobiia bacterium]|nr:DUF2269 family protein [Acidimicrobiia bacterium]
MTRYELFKFLHVVGAIAWVGGGIGLTILGRRLVAAKDHSALKSINDLGKALGNWLFIPASALTIIFGVAMVFDSPAIEFTDLWILIGFGGIIASGAVEGMIGQRAGREFATAIEQHGPGSARATAASKRMMLGGTLDVLLLLVVVWAMVVRPTL